MPTDGLIPSIGRKQDMVKRAEKPYPAEDLDISKLICWPIENCYKTEIVLDLEHLSVNSRTLFPDLDGLARSLWQTEIIRNCFQEAVEGRQHNRS